MASEEFSISRGELLAGLTGSLIPGIGFTAAFYLEILPLFRSLPGSITAEQAHQFVALNSLLLFSGVFIWITLNLMDFGSMVGKFAYRKLYQEGEEDE